MNAMVLIPFAGNVLALSQEQFQESLAAGQAMMGTPELAQQEAAAEEIRDADGMSELTGSQHRGSLEAARKSEIPHLRFGKYVRFRTQAVLDAMRAGLRDNVTSVRPEDVAPQRTKTAATTMLPVPRRRRRAPTR
jgi:hypothetical protein